MKKKPVVLMILDGYGLSDRKEGNGIALANTPVMDSLMKEYPFVKGYASGLSVGLPDGQMGNSEVGHLNMGAGRIVYQPLELINRSIESREFFKNDKILNVINHTKNNNSKLHIMGLISDGGIHSHINHLFALIDMCKEQGIDNIYLHLFTDGIDTGVTTGKGFVNKLEEKIK